MHRMRGGDAGIAIAQSPHQTTTGDNRLQYIKEVLTQLSLRLCLQRRLALVEQYVAQRQCGIEAQLHG